MPPQVSTWMGDHENAFWESFYNTSMLYLQVGEPVGISYRLNVAIINILWSIASGRRLHQQQQEFQSVYECIDKITQVNSNVFKQQYQTLQVVFYFSSCPELLSCHLCHFWPEFFLRASQKWNGEDITETSLWHFQRYATVQIFSYVAAKVLKFFIFFRNGSLSTKKNIEETELEIYKMLTLRRSRKEIHPFQVRDLEKYSLPNRFFIYFYVMAILPLICSI